MQAVMDYLRTFDPVTIQDVIQGAFTDEDSDKLSEFFIYRRNLACTDKWIARRYAKIDSQSDLYDDGLDHHLKTNENCLENDIYKEVGELQK
jgi:hypothetical protein